ncbi:DUF2189 domain-containing protein [Aureimonas leprariae]|uniref:DUF2189 domain-containing protein n=1 Tax=Plantimonas leprariae TaxID=2615207 RepID=A0A7V7TX30_9HYPH|nr:DUF2189 domain-containing protein [Aureimonas leprariae]KAB0680309.1 DUF2189 domain-containing protein [Aureimonas leprariae]
MAKLAENPISHRTLTDVHVRTIGVADVKAALREGWSDFMDKPSHYAFIVLIYPIVGVLIGLWTSGNGALPLLYPLVTGFALLGPIAALGLYEISRRRESGADMSWRHAFDVLSSPQLTSIVGFGVVLLAVFLLWLLSAQAIYALIYSGQGQESLTTFASDVLTSARGWTLLVVGNIVGLFFAIVALSISVVTFPLLLDRPMTVTAAVGTSLRATALNPVPILVWGGIIGVLLFAGSVPLFIGLAVVLPVLGHATWHLYRKLVE